MLNVEQASERVADLVSRARRAGADASDVFYAGEAATQVSIRLGALEDVERSESEDISVRVFVGKRSASASTADFSPAALTALAERVVAMAKEAPEDAFAGLAPEALLLTESLPKLDLDDGADVSPQRLREQALIAEDAARSVRGVTNSQGAGASAGQTIRALATSHGFVGAYSGSSHSLSASVIAGEGDGMERDYAHHSVRHLKDLESAASIGKLAGERAVMRLNPAKLKSGLTTVVFDPRVGNSLLGHLGTAISGGAIARKTSFLLEMLGKLIFPEGISVIDDPLRLRGIGSRPFDGEGLPKKITHIIDQGVLTGWLLDSASARQLGTMPTGHATRGAGAPSVGTSNVHMTAGALSPAELMADIKNGIYVTDLIGMGVSALTGDYSRGASGFVIENGELKGPVSEVTIAGNLLDMFANLSAANDLEFRYSNNVPTIRIDGMTLAGD
jgi:PmbA protein